MDKENNIPSLSKFLDHITHLASKHNVDISVDNSIVGKVSVSQSSYTHAADHYDANTQRTHLPPTYDANKVSTAPQEVDKAHYITAKSVGVIYLAPSPDSDPFVKVGDRVKANQTIFILEIMKVMNQIKSDKDGVVVEILANNGDVVECGQRLAIIGDE